tara:strand:- start:280 stop:399 length:120 start_codon:yes stop_codon:yes gene_type:complete
MEWGMPIAQTARFAEFVWIWDQMLGLGLPAHHRKMADWL